MPSQYLTSECLMVAVGQEIGNLKSLVSERSGGFEVELPPAVAFLGAVGAPLLSSSSFVLFFLSLTSSSSDPSSTSLAGGGGGGLLGFCEASGWSAIGASGSAFFAASLPLARLAMAPPPLTGPAPLTLWAEAVNAESAKTTRRRRKKEARTVFLLAGEEGEGRRWCYVWEERKRGGRGVSERELFFPSIAAQMRIGVSTLCARIDGFCARIDCAVCPSVSCRHLN